MAEASISSDGQAAGSVCCCVRHMNAASAAGSTAAGATHVHSYIHASARMSAMFTACVALRSATGTVDIAAEASISVSSATNSDATAAMPAPREARERVSTIEISAYAATVSPAATIVGAHVTPATCAQMKRMTEAAMVLEAWRSDICTASEEALKASVSTASVPKSGHGGNDQLRSAAM